MSRDLKRMNFSSTQHSARVSSLRIEGNLSRAAAQ